MRQTILRSITDIMATAVDVMGMEKDKDRAEDSISRILSDRRPRCRASKVAACSPEFAAGTAASIANRFDTARRSQLLFRNPRVFQQESLHIGDDEARVERSRTVDVPDATFPID